MAVRISAHLVCGPALIEPLLLGDRRKALEEIPPCHHPGNRSSSVPSVESKKLSCCWLQHLKTKAPKKLHQC